jgi:prevent-host-death family protein
VRIGTRELRANLSRYIRRVESGKRIVVTVHGRVVAEIVPPATAAAAGGPSRFDALVASGVIRPPSGRRARIRWPEIALPKGSAAVLIDLDRGDA